MMATSNEIIEAKYREIGAPPEVCLTDVAAEIRSISQNMQITVIVSVIEMGKRFERAKAQVKHGMWGEWCEKCTGYSQSMAENYIKLYREYGSEQLNLFGDLTKSQSIANLSMTKLLALTAIAPDEREEFVKENSITDKTTVKELQRMIKEKDKAAEAAAEKFEKMKEELKQSIKANEDIIADKDGTIKRLKAELEARESEPQALPEDEMSKMMAEADERAKEALKGEIKRMEAEKKHAEEKAVKLEKKYDNLNKKYTDQTEKMTKLETQAAEYERQKSEMQKTIDKLNRESMLGSNEKLVRLDMCFKTVQSDMDELKKALTAIEGAEQYDKLKTAVVNTLAAAIEGMENDK